MNTAEFLFELGRMAEKSEAEFRKSRYGAERRLMDDLAAESRWLLIRLACDARVARMGQEAPKDRSLPDLAVLFEDNAPVIADLWKLREGDERRAALVKAIVRKGVTKDTIEVATRYLNERLAGLDPDAARRKVEGWSRLRP